MATEKYIYVVVGSEDGNIAVMTSAKSAYEVAGNYVGETWLSDVWSTMEYLQEYGSCTLESAEHSGITATVERFVRNRWRLS